MEIDQLRTFLAVVEHGSFSRAGEVLRIGQSTVSFHIKALETALGSRLLDRGGGRVQATEAGRTLRTYATRMLSLRDEAIAKVKANEAGEAGRIAIAASTIPAEYLLPPVLAAFAKRHPGVSVRVDVSDSGGAFAALLAEQCDLALMGKEPRDRRVVASAFAADEVVLVGAPGNVPAGKVGPRELAGRRLIVREEGSGTRNAVEKILAAAAEEHASVFQIGSTEAAKRCAVEGLGLAFVSRRAVTEEIEAHRLAIVQLSGTPIRRRFWVARLRTAAPSGAVRALRGLLVQYHRYVFSGRGRGRRLARGRGACPRRCRPTRSGCLRRSRSRSRA
jgi:DNA-binding transcriptional LysR family regulator